MHFRLLIISPNYHPELTGIGKYNGEMAEWFASRGAEVRVITAPAYYPAWRIAPGYKGWCYSRENRIGVRVTRCPIWVPKQPTGATRILHLLSFAASSLPVVLWTALRWRPDAVFVVEPPLFSAVSALIAGRLCGSRTNLHIQDFEVDAAFDMGILRSGRIRKRVYALERGLMRRFDRVTTISTRMLDRLHAKTGCDRPETGLFPNWAELDRIYPLKSASSLRTQWGFTENDIVVLYSGNLGAKQGLEIVPEAARLLASNPSIRFVICGDGSERPKLERISGGMPNLSFKPLQPVERLNDLLNLADIHLLPQRSDAADLVLPSKLTNIFAVGKPVVATAEPDTGIWNILEGKGICVAPGDAQGLAAAISRLAADADMRAAMGENARRFAVSHLEKNAVLGRFAQELFRTKRAPGRVRLFGWRRRRAVTKGAMCQKPDPLQVAAIKGK